LQALVGEDHGLCPADRVGDQALAMQPLERPPVEAFPRPSLIVQRQSQQRQHRVVNLVVVQLHTVNATVPSARCQ
jgi:hypothetical protein